MADLNTDVNVDNVCPRQRNALFTPTAFDFNLDNQKAMNHSAHKNACCQQVEAPLHILEGERVHGVPNVGKLDPLLAASEVLLLHPRPGALGPRCGEACGQVTVLSLNQIMLCCLSQNSEIVSLQKFVCGETSC